MIKKIVLLIFVLGIPLALGAYSWFSGTPQTSKYSGPAEKIRIGNIGEYSILNIIAKEKGLFANNGLDAEVVEYASGPAAIADLLIGKIDVSIAADFVGVRNIFTSKDLRILSEVSNQKVFQVIARSDHGVSEPSDLKRKKVGVTRKGAGEFFLGRFLTLNNLTLKDITVLDLTPAEMISKLEKGEIDAVVIFDPHAYNLKNKLKDKVVSWSAQGNQETFALAYTMQSFIQDHPDVVKRYVKTLVEVDEYVARYPSEAQALIAAKLNYDMEYVKYMWKQILFSVKLDQELMLAMEDEARWVIENNLTTQSQIPNYLDYIYFNALEAIKPEAGSITH
jgi:NitT/TauT family transport system substrate-binding protein